MYELTRDGKHIFTGTENECYRRLHQYQPNSSNHALKYEGYKIEKID